MTQTSYPAVGAVSLGVADRGAWATTTVYAVHDLVEYGGTTWVCAVAHTSGATFDETKWTELDKFRGAWAANTRYNAADVVVNAGTLYSANATFTSSATFNATNWTALSGGGGGGGSVSRIGNIALPIASGGIPWATGPTAIGTANQARCALWVPDKSGTLHDLTVYNGATVAGNVRVGVFDTGQATAGTYTLLYDSGSVVQAGASGNQVVADPALAVSAGVPLILALMVDSTAATYGKWAPTSAATTSGVTLPSAAFPGSVNSAKMVATITFGSFAFANTTEANMVAASTGYFIMGRVA